MDGNALDGGASLFAASESNVDEPPRRRELSISVLRVQVRFYRRSRTSADLIRTPPHFVYEICCEWSEEPMSREPVPRSLALALDGPRSSFVDSPTSGSGRTRSNQGSIMSTGAWPPRPFTSSPSSASRSVSGGLLSPSSQQGLLKGPWWDPLPSRYVVKRKWHDLVNFHQVLVKDLLYDSSRGIRRVKSHQNPVLPKQADLEAWIQEYATVGDACALKRGEQWNELGDLHWVYTEKCLGPYFEEVNRLLQELPTELLLGCAALRRFVTVGVVGPRGDAAAEAGRGKVEPAQPAQHFLGQNPLMPSSEDIARAAQLQLRRRASAPDLRSMTGPAAGSGAAAARLVAGTSNRR